MSMGMFYADLEGPLRDWVRAAVPLAGNRVFFGLPKAVTYPAITLASDTFPSRWTPDEQMIVQADVLSGRLEDGGSKREASDVVLQLKNAVGNLAPHTPLGPVVALGAQFESARWAPIQGTAQPRYVCTVVLQLLAHAVNT